MNGGSGRWYEFNSSKTHQGPTNITSTADLGRIPVFVPPGTVLPLAPVVQSTQHLPGGALEIQVYAGENGSFTMVEDDGETTSYQVASHTRTTTFSWDDAKKTLSWSVKGSKTAVVGGFTQVFVTAFAGGSPPSVSSAKALGDGGAITIH